MFELTLEAFGEKEEGESMNEKLLRLFSRIGGMIPDEFESHVCLQIRFIAKY